jgi:predicted nucleic acid-binding protein
LGDASRLGEEHTLSFWDALIVGAAIQADAERLVSEDLQCGRRFGAFTVENPINYQDRKNPWRFRHYSDSLAMDFG